MENQKLGAKILAVYREISAVGKDMKIETRKGGGYQVRSEEAVLNAIRPLFVKNSLVLVQTKADGHKQGNITQVNTEYQLIDADTGEFITLAGYGEGSDTQDKGAGMAQTYALKNMLLKSFMLVSGEDADNESSDSKTAKQQEALKSAQVATADLIIKGHNTGKLTDAEVKVYERKLTQLVNSADLQALRSLYSEITNWIKSADTDPSLDA